MKITDPILKEKVWFTIISGMISSSRDLRHYMANVNIVIKTQWQAIWNKDWRWKVIFLDWDFCCQKFNEYESMDSLQAVSRKLSAFRQIRCTKIFSLAGVVIFSSFFPTFSFLFECLWAEHALSTFHRPYPSLLDSEPLILGILERGSQMHIIAISFPIDPHVPEEETRCMFLSREGVITWMFNHNYLSNKWSTYLCQPPVNFC